MASGYFFKFGTGLMAAQAVARTHLHSSIGSLHALTQSMGLPTGVRS